MFERLAQVIAGGAGNRNSWVRTLSLQPISESLVKPRAVFTCHALIRSHLNERVSESEAARSGLLDQSLPFQCFEVTLDERVCIARKKRAHDVYVELHSKVRS
jgi:hypothetical protein